MPFSEECLILLYRPEIEWWLSRAEEVGNAKLCNGYSFAFALKAEKVPDRKHNSVPKQYYIALYLKRG